MLNLSTIILTSLLTLTTLTPSLPDSYENNIDPNLFSNSLSQVESTEDKTSGVVTNKKLEELKSYKGNTNEFNAYYYYTNYSDVQEAIGTDADGLLIHYYTVGRHSNRVADKLVEYKKSESKSTINKVEEETIPEETEVYEHPNVENATYILNIKTGKFHTPDCSWVDHIAPEHYTAVDFTYEVVTEELGYVGCKHCYPH